MNSEVSGTKIGSSMMINSEISRCNVENSTTNFDISSSNSENCTTNSDISRCNSENSMANLEISDPDNFEISRSNSENSTMTSEISRSILENATMNSQKIINLEISSTKSVERYLKRKSQPCPKRDKKKSFMAVISLAFKTILPLFDLGSDLYTLTRYYDPDKTLMQRMFYGGLSMILFHNVLSGLYGVYEIRKMSKRGQLIVWSNLKWKFFTVVLYASGMGTVVAPIELLVKTNQDSRR